MKINIHQALKDDKVHYFAREESYDLILDHDPGIAILIIRIREAYPDCNIFNVDTNTWIVYNSNNEQQKIKPATGNTRREEIIQAVSSCVLRDRQDTYGDAEDSFADIALRWNNYLSRRLHLPITITAQDVAIMMADLKITRAATSPNHLDNMIDGAGYFVCAGGIAKSREQK